MIPKRHNVIILFAILTGIVSAEVPEGSLLSMDSGQSQLLLNPMLSAGDIPNTGSWRMSKARAVAVTEPTPKLGSHALRFEAESQINSGKGDFSLVRSLPGELTAAGLWVHLEADANVKELGFQVYDAEGEALMYKISADWEGWRWVEFDLEAAKPSQAYPQADKNQKLDQPVAGLHLFWFTERPGPTALTVDALAGRARLPDTGQGLRARLYGSPDVEPGESLHAAVLIENHSSETHTLKVKYRLGSNSELIDANEPHPGYGLNRAEGRPSWVEVNGERIDNDSLTDGSLFTGIDQRLADPGYTEAFHFVDLGERLNITRLEYRAGDANWIWNMDIAASGDGKTYVPVEGMQNLDVHKKWGEQTLNVPTPFTARYLRLRYHRQGEALQYLRLPIELRVFDAAREADFVFAAPGNEVSTGTLEEEIPAGAFRWMAIPAFPVEQGSYLLEARVENGDGAHLLSRTFFTLPQRIETLPEDSRFGVNSSSFDLFDINRRLGVGWIRFENMKWQMYCNAPDHFAFDGSIAPWHVKHDEFVEEYHKRGMKVLPYTFQTPSWSTTAPPDVEKNRHSWPPKDYADYGEAMYQLAARYASKEVPGETLRTEDKRSGLGRISAYQLWNEPNLVGPTWAPWVASMEEYYEVFRQGAEGVKRADPNARVSHAGYAGIGVGLVNELKTYTYEDGKTPLDFTDLITVHYYSGRQDPEVATRDPNANRSGQPIEGMPTFPERIRELTDWRDRNAPGKEIWITETGYDVGGPIGLGEREQAMKIPRVTLLHLAAGVDKVFIYRESGSSPAMHAGAGLVRNDHSKRPSYFTYATLIREFEGVEPGRPLRLVTENPDVWIYLWRRHGKPFITAWTVTGTDDLDFGACRVTDSFSATSKKASGERVTLTSFPKYIEVDADTLPAVWRERAAAAQAREQAHQARMSRDLARRAYLFDFGGTEFVGTLTLGEVRTFTPVLHTQLFDGDKDFGFQPDAMMDQDQHWIPGHLNRDSVRFRQGQTFRFKVEPGRYRLQVNASPMGDSETLTVQAGGREHSLSLLPVETRRAATVEMDLEVTGREVILGVEKMAHLHWLTLVER